jgi:hypothetical protein
MGKGHPPQRLIGPLPCKAPLPRELKAELEV